MTDSYTYLWPRLDFLALAPEAVYHQAQLATGQYVEGLEIRSLDAETLGGMQREAAGGMW